MAKRRLSRRRDFLRRSGIATLTAVAEPGSRFGPRMEDYAGGDHLQRRTDVVL